MKRILFRSGLLTMLIWMGFGMGAVAEKSSAFFSEPEVIQSSEFQEIFARVGDDIYMAGQPTELGLSSLAGLGITTVVNLRTSFEMDNRGVVPFDEAVTLAELGLEYVHIPLGGPDTPYAPDAVDKLAAALDAASGKVLLHCTVAWRASHLWTAYLVRHHGLTVPEAIAITRQLNFGEIPVEKFLGQPLSIDIQADLEKEDE